ncbi:D-alanyl-D-alanine carboxypeptidase family protein [Candidatus Magnetominusculus dajiuhuensis]|uniref:D-alanyl-D-alanine carboxypeptidase family protein n=1 Tax=Candidatus Magnetominusculus dajiuhuensis TaxID=3137712 RepID=UPI003B42920E
MERGFLRMLRHYVFLPMVMCVVLLTANSFAKAASEPSPREITARSAVIMDGDKILYAKNPDFKQPPASTTKLITAMVVLDHMKPNDIVTISCDAARLHSPHVALREGERFYVKDLLSLLLMKSVNGAALAFAEAVSGTERDFVTLMNEKARGIGAMNTRFINAHGLPGEGQYITAYDLATIMKKSLDYSLIKETINTKTKTVDSIDGRAFVLSNTNKLLWSDGDLVGGKTGFTNAARHCLAFAAEKGENMLVAALLGDGRRSDLWRDAKFVLSKGYNISESHARPIIYYSSIANEKVRTATRPAHHVKGKKHKSKKRKSGRDSRVETIAALDEVAMEDAGYSGQDTMAKKSKGKKRSKKSKAQAYNRRPIPNNAIDMADNRFYKEIIGG